MSLLKVFFQTSSMTLLSRILGFVRDVVVANSFGAGGLTDAFFVAFRIPNLLRRLFAEGAFSQAFVPLLGSTRELQGDLAARALMDHVATILAVALVVTTGLGIWFAPQIVTLTAPGFRADPVKFQTTVALLRVTFPYILLIALVALAAGILNTWHLFWVPAITPVLLNLSMIGCALGLAPHLEHPIMALAWGTFLGGLLQLGFQWPFLRRIQMVPRWRWNPRAPGVQRVLRLMAPAVLGVSVGQISLLISTLFASYLPSGSVSWLFYADRLMEFPTGLLGVALGTILLPHLVRYYSAGDLERYRGLLDWGLRLTMLLTLPAAVVMAVAGVPLIATLFQRGAFSTQDVMMVRPALLAYSLGLVGLIAVKILAPGFYARQDIRTPVRIALLVLLVTQFMNFVFMHWWQHAGLALATGLGACLNATLLYLGLYRKGHYRPLPGWPRFLGRLVLALGALGLTLKGLGSSPEFWLHASTEQRVGHLSGLLLAGVVVYFGSLWILGMRGRDFIRPDPVRIGGKGEGASDFCDN